jgi:hypothetical protein
LLALVVLLVAWLAESPLALLDDALEGLDALEVLALETLSELLELGDSLALVWPPPFPLPLAEAAPDVLSTFAESDLCENEESEFLFLWA